MRNATILVSVFLGLTLGGTAQAAPKQIGSAIKVVNQVSAEYERDRRDLGRGDQVHQDELIEVGQDSLSELEFADQTKLALGPGARLMLDKFVYNGERSKGDIVVDLVKGAFRFVTGVAAKPSYRIRTPAAAITVRGTIFDVYIEPSNTVWLLLLDGNISACNVRGECRQLTDPGQILKITPDGDFGKAERYSEQDDMSEDDVDEAFPFLRETLTILPTPPLTRDAVITTPKRETYPKRDPKPKHTDRNTYKKKKRAYYERKKRQLELRKKRYLEKKRYRERKRRRARRERRRRSDSGLSDAAKTAIGIGIGIGIGKALGGGGGKRHHRRDHRNSPY